MPCCTLCSSFFFFNDTATTEIYTLSLHDALPILPSVGGISHNPAEHTAPEHIEAGAKDRKSTRLNSSHQIISYAVFCLKKKKRTRILVNDHFSETQLTLESPYRAHSSSPH